MLFHRNDLNRENKHDGEDEKNYQQRIAHDIIAREWRRYQEAKDLREAEVQLRENIKDFELGCCGDGICGSGRDGDLHQSHRRPTVREKREAVIRSLADFRHEIAVQTQRIKFGRTRRRDIHRFMDEAASRKTHTELELRNLRIDCVDEREHVWKRTMQNECKRLEYRIEMAMAELESWRIYTDRAEKKMVDLHNAYDNACTLLDKLCVTEMDEREKSCRLQLSISQRQSDLALEKRILYERNKWRIKDEAPKTLANQNCTISLAEEHDARFPTHKIKEIMDDVIKSSMEFTAKMISHS